MTEASLSYTSTREKIVLAAYDLEHVALGRLGDGLRRLALKGLVARLCAGERRVSADDPLLQLPIAASKLLRHLIER